MPQPPAAPTRLCTVCDKKLDARSEGTTHLGCKTAAKTSPTGVPMPDRPGLLSSCRLPTAAAVLCTGGAIQSHLFTLGYTEQLGQAAGAFVGVGLIWHGVRLDRYTRARNAQHLWARLARITGDAPGARLEHMRVRAYEARVPSRVTVRPGNGFDPRALGEMRAALADSLGVESHKVRSERLRGGRYRLWLDKAAKAPASPMNAERPWQSVPPMDPSLLKALEAGGTEGAANPAAAARVQEALAAAIEDAEARVEVQEWNGSAPKSLLLTYPPRVAPRAEVSRAALVTTMHALHRPQGDWFARWHHEQDRFLIEDAPDPLARPIPLPIAEESPDLLAGVTIGELENGDPWKVPLMGGMHTLVAGATGAGKGSVLWGVVRALEHLIRDGRVRLWIADPKGGIEFDRAEAFAYRFAVGQDEIAKMFRDAAQEMTRKTVAQRGQGRKIETPTQETPLDLVIIDEIAAVVGQAADSATVTAANAPLVKMLTQGRAPLFTVMAAVQDPRKENLKLRGLFTHTIALRLSEPGEVNLVLGAGVRAKGATADLIPESLPGVGFAVRDARAGAQRGRAAFTSDEEIDRFTARLALPTLV